MADVVVDSAFWADRRVLVTGHTGFKGAWLSLWLASMGARVTGLADEAPPSPWIFSAAQVAKDLHADLRVDVRDREAVARAVKNARPSVVLHLAAQPFVRRSYAEPVETYATNVMGTVHVLDAVRRAPTDIRAVVIVTSDKCYENSVGATRAFVETDPMGGQDPYSNSKGAAELVTDAYRRSFFSDPEGPQIASARAGNVIGGGDWGEDRLVPDIMRAALTGARIPIRRPDAVRPWQHVLNPLEGYLLLAQALAISGGPEVTTGFNFGPGDEALRPVRDLVALLAARWPEPLQWEIDDAPSPHEAAYLALDSTQARERLGWTPRWDLDMAIEAIVDWFLAVRDQRDLRAITLAQIEQYVAMACE